MKLWLLGMSIVCVSIEGMRAIRPRTTPPIKQMRAYHNGKNGVPFKVATKPYLVQKMNIVTQTMNDLQKKEAQSIHAQIQFYAIEATLTNAVAILETLDPIGRSLVLDQLDERGRTLLIKAAKIGYLDFMELLLHYRANAEVADDEGLTALSINPTRLTQKIVQQLIDNNVDVTHLDRRKRQALHYLALRPKVDVVKVGEMQHLDDFSMFERTNAKVARLLIPQGANMYARDEKGKTPIDFAIESNNKEMLKAFIDCGAHREGIIEKANDTLKQDLLAHYKIY